jgi:hypothetical protein
MVWLLHLEVWCPGVLHEFAEGMRDESDYVRVPLIENKCYMCIANRSLYGFPSWRSYLRLWA